MSHVSNWTHVDIFTVDQASALWCDADPMTLLSYDVGTPSEIMAIKQLLIGGITDGQLVADSSKNSLTMIGNYSSSLVSRADLEEFAKSKQLFPAFLFDTLAPFDDIRAKTENSAIYPERDNRNGNAKPDRGGRPPKYDWDSFTLEIIHRANTPDGLPETQAALIRDMLLWFSSEYNAEPAESSVKQRISKIYSYLNKGKNS